MTVIERSHWRYMVRSHTRQMWHYVKRYYGENGKEAFDCSCERSIYTEKECPHIREVKEYIKTNSS